VRWCAHTPERSIPKEPILRIFIQIIAHYFLFRSGNLILTNTWNLLWLILDLLDIVGTSTFGNEELSIFGDVQFYFIFVRAGNVALILLNHWNIISWFGTQLSNLIDNWLIHIGIVIDQFVSLETPLILAFLWWVHHVFNRNFEPILRMIWCPSLVDEFSLSSLSYLEWRVSIALWYLVYLSIVLSWWRIRTVYFLWGVILAVPTGTWTRLNTTNCLWQIRKLKSICAFKIVALS
jgi:hypothetical protein